jgi:hypothetical protein
MADKTTHEELEDDINVAASGDEPPRPLLELEAELCTLAGHIAAATGDFLVLLGEFDEREGWAGVGVSSCAHWLSWRCAMSLATARDHVRVARRLRGLPETRRAIRQGRLSYSKVRALCRIATPATETELVETAQHATAAQTERLVQSIRRVAEDKVPSDRPPREKRPLRLTWSWDPDGILEIHARLDPEDGAAFLAVARSLDEADRGAGPRARTHGHRIVDVDCGDDDGGCGIGSGPEQDRTADPQTDPEGHDDLADQQTNEHDSHHDSDEVATDRSTLYVYTARSGSCSSEFVGRLLRAAADGLAAAGEDERAVPEVVVHVDADVLTRSVQPQDPARVRRAHLEEGPALSLAVIERLACDSRISLTSHASDGRTLDMGRSTRRPSRRQRKALLRRDAGCATPGCRATRFLHAHHVVYWSQGGRTDLDNLVLLCGRHHRLLHDGAFTIEALGRQRFRFRDADGSVLDVAPALRGERGQLTLTYSAPDGQAIDPDTVTGRWDGTPLDPDLLISSYSYLRDVETGRAARSRDPWAEVVAVDGPSGSAA